MKHTIKPNELRIGNLVNYHTAEGDILPNVIDWKALKWLTEDPKGFNLVHSPIPITEEWLKKMGFSNTIDVFYTPCGFYEFHLSGVFNSSHAYYNYTIATKVIYLHQLQNLYFALAEQELTLIPPSAESAK